MAAGILRTIEAPPERWARERGALSRLVLFCKTKPLGAGGGFIILLMVLVAILAPFISPYDPYALHGDDSLAPPSSRYLLGADDLGRDLLSRIIWGARVSLQVGLIAVGVGSILGSFWGILSGYAGGKTDLAVQRVMDTLMAFPSIVLALTMVAILGNNITNVMLAIGIVMTPGVNRVVRGATLSVKENQYIEAARTIGCGHLRIIWLHILPNVTAPIIVLATVGLGSAIISEATLSFLGLGTPPPTPSWGGMLTYQARQYMERAPWIAVFPGIAISLAVYGFNLLGDALRDVWDPRLRH